MTRALVPPASVREARPGEVATVLGMYDWLFAPPGAPPPRWDPESAAGRLANAIDSASAAVLVATVDVELAGFCTAYDDIASVRFGRRVWVEDLAVAPDRRSAGIGSQLLAAARAWARGRGATHLELDSSDAREAAHRFYERERPSWRSACFGWDLVAGD